MYLIVLGFLMQSQAEQMVLRYVLLMFVSHVLALYVLLPKQKLVFDLFWCVPEESIDLQSAELIEPEMEFKIPPALRKLRVS